MAFFKNDGYVPGKSYQSDGPSCEPYYNRDNTVLHQMDIARVEGKLSAANERISQLEKQLEEHRFQRQLDAMVKNEMRKEIYLMQKCIDSADVLIKAMTRNS